MIRQLLAWLERPRYQIDRLPAGAEPDNMLVLKAMVRDLLDDRRSERRSHYARALLYFLMFALPVFLYVAIYAWSAGFRFGPSAEVVGVVRIEGEIASGAIASADRVNAALKKAFESSNVKAIVLAIDSPGGAPVEAERIYRTIEAYKRSHPKPVYAAINNLGASAAYMIALHTDKIYAGQYSLVGSVGAVLAGWDFHKALERIDVAQRVYASGNLKAMLNPFLPMSPEADKKARELVAQMGEQFRAELVAQRKSKLKGGVDYGSGEIWGGIEAKDVGMIDEIGTLDEVIKTTWDLKSHDFGPSAGQLPFMGTAAQWLKGVVIDALKNPTVLQ